MAKKKFYRLDDSDLKLIDKNAKPTLKRVTPRELAALRKRLEAELKAEVAKIVGKKAPVRRAKKK
jgi:hypothetical protein